MTEFLQGMVLGIIQGITEWLPISSEGINTLVQLHFFNRPAAEAIQISIWLHTGTVLAALIYFRKDITDLCRNLPQYTRSMKSAERTERDKVTTFLIVSTLLTVAVGAPLYYFIVRSQHLSHEDISTGIVTAIIGGFLIITGLLQRYARRSPATRTSAGLKDGVIVGVVQAFSVFPGLSRSGLTMSALLLRGHRAEHAARMSFLMSIPAVLAAALGLGIMGDVILEPAAVTGTVFAFIFGLLTIGMMLKLAVRIAFWKFCLVIGVLSFLPLIIDRL